MHPGGPLPDADHYIILGVARAAGAAEIRRAYRQLALRLHPDRAGVAATERFQRLSLAYRVLSDPTTRAAYDAGFRAADHGAPRPWTRAARPPAPPGIRPLLPRLSGPLSTLLARGLARRRDDGVIELYLTAEEAQLGGTAALGVPLRVSCPTCGGCAQRNSLWCFRCEFEGSVLEEVTVCLAIPAGVLPGATFTIRIDPRGVAPPLRLCVRR